jgi:predicted enzyme related to lactoylglutathione lyase
MGKLRHIAITVPDMEKAAQFYEANFAMKRVRQREISIMHSDGVMSLAILKFRTDQQAGDERGKDFHGLHHFGFVVDDLDETMEKIEANGGKYFMTLPDVPGVEVETKVKDVNGVVVDISEHDWHREESA